ncbi:hypothetical protein [Paludibacterium denitrificans]|nr:hypothetical protein [Paludibacterium denitrificans]
MRRSCLSVRRISNCTRRGAAVPHASLADITKLELLGAVYRVGLHVPARGSANVMADLSHAKLMQLNIRLQQRVPVSLNPAGCAYSPGKGARHDQPSSTS